LPIARALADAGHELRWRPIVHVTQGTMANATPDLIRPALEGLASLDVLVLVSTGNRPVEELGLGPLPANARVAKFLSYAELLPKLSVMVTNGGYGGVQMALSNGVPLVVAGASEDKPEVAARIPWSGTGLNLKTATPTAQAVRNAVRKILDDSRYRARASALAGEYRSHDAIARAVEVVEAAAGVGRTPGFEPNATAKLTGCQVHACRAGAGSTSAALAEDGAMKGKRGTDVTDATPFKIAKAEALCDRAVGSCQRARAYAKARPNLR
jgi:hypothetical protein